jgi:hypothetical protein
MPFKYVSAEKEKNKFEDRTFAAATKKCINGLILNPHLHNF